jgi:hypothetical protein
MEVEKIGSNNCGQKFICPFLSNILGFSSVVKQLDSVESTK